MTYEFSISKSNIYELSHSINLNAEFTLSYNNEEHLTEVMWDNKRLICYGYVFDVRNPEKTTEDTLKYIIKKNSIVEDAAYLNGQYILLLINDNTISVVADATSLVPVFINEESNEITNIPVENKGHKFFNSNLIFNLNTGSSIRLNVEPIKENHSNQIIKLLENQYKYFLNKKLVMDFKPNNYMKTLISIMKPALYNNFLRATNNENETIDQKFTESIRKDFNMNYIEDNEGSTNLIYLRNQLFDFKQFLNHENKDSSKVMLDNNFKNLSKMMQSAELNILTRKRSQSKELSKTGLLFDPFNAHIIYQTLLNHSKDLKNITAYVTKEMLPSINYYDFVNDNLLKETNNNLKKEIERLKINQITSDNEQFLLDTKLSYFKVSENLDGKLKEKEIIVHPAKQEIKAKEKFVINYENPGDGMVLIKSFFSNKNNGQTIIVNIDGKRFTVDELYKGILFDVKSKLKITMEYKNSRRSLPWQKAGTLLIREK